MSRRFQDSKGGPRRIRRYTAREKRTWLTELEVFAATRLAEHIRTTGTDVEILSVRPDETSTRSRAVDFEAVVDGRVVGIEITRLIPAARSMYEISAIERHLGEQLGEIPARRSLGSVAVEIEYGALARSTEVDFDVENIVEGLSEILESIDPAELRQSVEVSVPQRYATARRIRIKRLERPGNGLVFITGSDEWGGAIQPRSDAFVEHLLTTKSDQGRNWKEVWIVIVDRDGLVDADNLRASVAERLGQVPPNWTRIYLIPAPAGRPAAELVWPAAAE